MCLMRESVNLFIHSLFDDIRKSKKIHNINDNDRNNNKKKTKNCVVFFHSIMRGFIVMFQNEKFITVSYTI